MGISYSCIYFEEDNNVALNAVYFTPVVNLGQKWLLITDINQNCIMGTDNKAPKDKMG